MSIEIHATLGPACSTNQAIQELLQSGADVIRLNLSHYQPEDLPAAVKQIRERSASIRKDVRIACDIRGRKLRIGPLEKDYVVLAQGQHYVLHNASEEQEQLGNAISAWINHPCLSSQVDPGTRILLDDGAIQLTAEDINRDSIICRVEVGGVLPARSGLNIPGKASGLPSIRKKDMADLDILSNLDIDATYLSYVETEHDIRLLRSELAHRHMSLPIIAKIERNVALRNLDAIAESADAICLARGDLGVEIPLADIPFVQKQVIDRTKAAGKPFILAGEVLLSLVTRQIPARAELTDIAIALRQGVDGFILSDETAVGIAPAKAVETLNELIKDMNVHLENRETLLPNI